MMEGRAREHLLESLTGIKSSKRTFYSEYREKERRLERAISSIASISAALCHTTDGVASLVRAVVHVAAQHFDADWAVIELTTESSHRWMACRDHDGTVVLEAAWVPASLDTIIRQVLEQQRLIVGKDGGVLRTLGAPMFLHDRVIGVLAVTPTSGFALDEREISVLQTLANQAAVAVENARLYEESERLRARATALYEEACEKKAELEKKNRQLDKARRCLAKARQNEILNNERNRIARELHDSVAQHLISIGMNLEWCRAQLHHQPEVHMRICNAKELARSAIGRMRAAIFELSTITSGQSGLVAALNELAIDFEKTSHLHVHLHIAQEPQPLAADLEHALYHIVQEALFNTYKHAQATSVRIELRFKADTVQTVISDDGIGIAWEDIKRGLSPTAESSTHFGLRNMSERARELGGKLKITPCRRGGTTVCVTVPKRS